MYKTPGHLCKSTNSPIAKMANKKQSLLKQNAIEKHFNFRKSSLLLVVKEGGLMQFLTPKPKIFKVKNVKVQIQPKLNFVD